MIRERNRLHRRTIRAAVAAASSLVCLAALTTTATAAPSEGAPVPPTPPDGPSRTVTLVTGDQVVVTPRDGREPLVAVEPGAGRDGVGFSAHVTEHEITVTPMDAVPLLAKGRLDRRLFEVHRLLASGYGDERTGDLPLIASRPVASLRARRTISAGGLTAVRAEKDGLAKAWREFVADPSARLWLDGKVKASLDGSVPQIGAPAAWERGLTGEGVTVAVLDTGVDGEHPDLEVAEARNFTPAASADDGFGHGTHVASVIAGSGEASGGKYRGVAPDARLVSGKVLDDSGQGQESWLIAGMTWAAKEARADVVNLSMSCFCDSPAIDPVEQAVNELSAETDTLFVAAAGDLTWPLPGVIALPAAAESALAVSSVDPQDRPASAVTGPRTGDYLVKPEIMAPGVGIVAARAGGTSAGSPVDDSYTRMSGTSVATPHVAGAAALVAQRHPGWDGERLKSMLMGSAKRLPAEPGAQGAGRVDAGAAVARSVSASPPSLHADVAWPDSGTSEAVREVTYTNASDAPVELDLGVELAGPNGATLPAGAATLDTNRVVVPANGEATATLTFRGMDGVTAGVYQGALTATGADGAVTTPVAAFMEPPTSVVTIKATDRDGAPVPYYFAVLTNLETGQYYDASPNGDGTATARVPVGTYDVAGQFGTGSSWTSGFRKVYELRAGANAIPMDARDTTPVELTNDQPDAELTDATVTLNRVAGPGYAIMYLYGDAQRRVSVQTGADDRIAYTALSTWQKAGADPSPYVFHDFRSAGGGVPDDPALRTRRADMARIRTSVRALDDAATGSLRTFAYGTEGSLATNVTRPVPDTFTLYLRAGDQVRWGQELRLNDESGDNFARMFKDERTYRAGPHVDAWNAAVLGPTPADWSNVRDGNVLAVASSCSTTGALDSCGRDYTGTGTISLSRDGTVLQEKRIGGTSTPEIEVTVPAEAGTYTVRESIAWPDRPAGSVATEQNTVWTFRSAGTEEAERLPLLAARFLPAGLDERNRAPGDRAALVPYWVERNPGAPAVPVTSTKVEASFDDGATWRVLRAAGGPALGVVQVDPDDGAEFVSLRATAEDRDGNTVTQTVIRAYGLS
ncbi:S8 family serine peptidase [Actinomadura sp. LOL_016]|uniref:S8 family serine peptidase n=1 Tax=unclassified Actinomadura TaxID=2626254 RepID=UPI003A7F93AD